MNLCPAEENSVLLRTEEQDGSRAAAVSMLTSRVFINVSTYGHVTGGSPAIWGTGWKYLVEILSRSSYKHKAQSNKTHDPYRQKLERGLEPFGLGVHPFTGTGVYSPDRRQKRSPARPGCYSPQIDHWQLSPSGSNATSPHCSNPLCRLSSYTSRQLFSCLAWFVLWHVIIFELLLSYYCKEESSGRTNLKSPPRRLWRQHHAEPTVRPTWCWLAYTKP